MNNDGLISKDQLTKILKNRLSKKDLDELTKEADPGAVGMVDYRGEVSIIYLHEFIFYIVHSILQDPI